MEEKYWLVYGKRKQKYKARKVICKTCGKELLVIKSRTNGGYCQSCNAKNVNPKVKDDELYIQEGKTRRRARKINCKKCKKELLVRPTRKHCGYCQACNAKKRCKENYIYGINTYREKAFKYFPKECFCCKEDSFEKIIIHHIDCNHKNNDISNLVVLCKSCHRSIHWRIRKGLTNDEAIVAIKEKKNKIGKK